MPNVHQIRPTDGEATEEMRARVEQAARARRIAKLLAERRAARPSRRYTQVALLVAAAAFVDWVAVAAHTALNHGRRHLDPALGAHLTFVVFLSMAACVLAVGWALMDDQRRRDVQRDELDELRQEERMELLAELVNATSTLPWQGFVEGYREAGRRVGGAPEPPARGVMPVWPRNSGNRHGRHPG